MKKTANFNKYQQNHDLKKKAQFCNTLMELVKTLPDRERNVIIDLFGLKGEKKTYSQVAELKGISVERVKEIEAEALRKLRHPSRSLQRESIIEDE